jgi:hypothetical protein
MDPQLDTAQRRADLAEIAKKLVLQINEIQPFQWDKHDEKDQAIVLAALLATEQQARRLALEDAAKVAREFKGGFTLDVFTCKLIPDKDGPWTLGTDIAETLDRLREGQ